MNINYGHVFSVNNEPSIVQLWKERKKKRKTYKRVTKTTATKRKKEREKKQHQEYLNKIKYIESHKQLHIFYKDLAKGSCESDGGCAIATF